MIIILNQELLLFYELQNLLAIFCEKVYNIFIIFSIFFKQFWIILTNYFLNYFYLLK